MLNDAKDGGHNYEKRNLGCGTDVVDETGGVVEILCWIFHLEFIKNSLITLLMMVTIIMITMITIMMMTIIFRQSTQTFTPAGMIMMMKMTMTMMIMIITNLYASSWFLTMFMKMMMTMIMMTVVIMMTMKTTMAMKIMMIMFR